MPQVSIRIGPKSYTVGCGEGEQDKIAALGALIDEKYAQLGSARAPLEATNLVFTALFMADELAELRARMDNAEDGSQAKIAAIRAKADEAVQTARAAEKAADAKAQAALAEIADARQKLQAAIEDAEKRSASEATKEIEQAQAGTGGKKAEMRAEIETLRKDEERVREEVTTLKSELSQLREANARQHELFGPAMDAEDVAGALETLAERTEAAAIALEQSGDSA